MASAASACSVRRAALNASLNRCSGFLKARGAQRLALALDAGQRAAARPRGRGARIRPSPTSTASTPTRSRSSSCSRVWKPDSETTVLPAGHVGEQLVGALEVDGEVGEVAVVDADDVGVDDLQRALELVLVVDLDEHVEVERRAPRGAARRGRRRRARRRSAGSRRRPRPRTRRPGRGRRRSPCAGSAARCARARLAQVVQRAAEVRALGEDRQRGRAAALVGADDLGHRSRRARISPALRRAALVLGDDRHAGRRQRLGERAVLARRRRRAARARPAGPPRGGGATSSRVASTMRSRTLIARAPAQLARVSCARRRRASRAARDPVVDAPSRGGLDALGERCRRSAAGVDRGAGVEQREVARRRRARRRGSRAWSRALSSGVPPATASGGVGSIPTSCGRDDVALDGVAVDLDDVGRRGRAHLVQAILAGHYQRAVDAQARQRARHPLEVGGVRDADELAARARRDWSAARGS